MDRVTKPQKKMLITLLRETKNMEGKKEKEWYWEKIQAALNTIGPKKTIIQWKKCWRDMRLTTRKKLAELKRCQLAGGSPPPGIELNHEDNDIIDIVGTQYFYEEMNGELKPENFLPNFDYVPEHFCDAILTAAAAGHTQHAQQQHSKEPSSHVLQQHDHQTNDTETNDAPVSSNEAHAHGGAPFQTSGFAHVPHYSTADHDGASPQSNTLHPHGYHGAGLHPHLLRRQQQQHASSMATKRENVFEEKLLQFLQEAFPKKHKRRKSRDPDKLFLLSLYDEIKRIPEEIRLEVKSELIQVLKRYQKKSAIKQEKSYTQTASSSSAKHNSVAATAAAAAASDKIQQVPQQQATQLTNSMYQLQKKYDKGGEKDSASPQSLVESVQHNTRETSSSAGGAAVPLHAAQQMSHSLFDFHKKFDDSGEKNNQKDQRGRHVEPSAHQQQHGLLQHQQQPPPPPSSASNEQHHIHHAQMPHGIIFPLTQIRNEQQQSSAQQQHHPHNPHQQQQQQQQSQSQHHPSTIFGTSTPTAAMSADRSALPYENVG